MGSWPAFLAAWGPVDQGFGAGQGVKCYHSEHLYGEFWHRAFIVSPDTPYTNYVINCGANIEASHGVVGIWREADARVRGAKRVQVEPHMSITGALSAEWVPIKPKTDAAFLFGLIHRIIHERKWGEVCDVPFLTERTNSPYLVGPNGWFLRDPATEKPLIWDLADNTAKPFDAAIKQPAMKGTFTLGGVEVGPDHQKERSTLLRGQARVPEAARPHEALHAGLGGGGMRRAGRQDPAHRRRISRPCLHRRDDRHRGPHAAVPPGRRAGGEGHRQRLGRLSLLLVAEDAGRSWWARSKCRAAFSARR